jgi:COP9 signalosome complex subunit 2
MQDDEENEGGDELTFDVQIANLFYEAEDMVREEPKTALTKFEQLLNLAKENSAELNDESKSSMFNSLVHIVVLLYNANRTGDMVKQYTHLLTFIPKVTRNEGAEAIDRVLNAVATSKDFSLLENIYSITSTTLQSMPDTERMLFNVNMKLCKTYVDKEDYPAAHTVLAKLHKSCLTASGQDDKKNKGSELLEIYALQIKLSFAAHDANKMKELYEKTKDLTAAVKDPRSQSIIRECWGQMFGDEGQWQRAYVEFYQAFSYYQEVGNRERAKQCLKYVVVANMLSGGEQNPFDAREAKVYQNEPDIAAIVNLRTAFERSDVSAFTASLNEINKSADKFIKTHLHSMIRDFQSRAVLSIVKSYRRIKLDYLAQALTVSKEKVEQILVQLILDGELAGKIDQVKGLLDLTGNAAGGAKKYNALLTWTNTLNHLTQTIAQPLLPIH